MKSISRWLKENSEFDTIQTSEGDICIRSGNKAYKVEEDCKGYDRGRYFLVQRPTSVSINLIER